MNLESQINQFLQLTAGRFMDLGKPHLCRPVSLQLNLADSDTCFPESSLAPDFSGICTQCFHWQGYSISVYYNRVVRPGTFRVCFDSVVHRSPEYEIVTNIKPTDSS